MQCTTCLNKKEQSEMAIRGAKTRSYCKSCDSKRRRNRPSEINQRKWAVAKRARMRRSTESKDVARCILLDSRQSDKKHNRCNDLTIEQIEMLIRLGCSYCKTSCKSIRMTLDRVDNSIGHTINNVKPACIRCNYIRRDMPFEAWELLISAIQTTTESGKFGNWIGGWRGGSNGKEVVSGR